jgi:hypothetical protein
VKYEDNEYYLATPITNVQVGGNVYVSGYDTFGDITGYANVDHNLIRIQTTSSVISVSPNKLYNILGSTKSGFKYLLNKKDLDIQFGNHSTKEIIDYFVKFCKNESDLDKCGTDFNNYFFNKKSNKIQVELVDETKTELFFGDIKPTLY